MAVSYVSKANAVAWSSGTTITVSHTLSAGSNKGLIAIVMAGYYSPVADISNIKWNTTETFSSLVNYTALSYYRIGIYALANPTVKSDSAIVTFDSTNLSWANMQLLEVDGLHQTVMGGTPVNANDWGKNNQGPAAVGATANEDLVVAALTMNSATASMTPDYTRLDDIVVTNNHCDAQYVAATASSYNMYWTFGENLTWIGSGVALKAAPAVAAAFGFDMQECYDSEKPIIVPKVFVPV